MSGGVMRDFGTSLRAMLSAVVLTVFAVSSVSAAEKRVDFNRDIRPLLSDKCFACHGPDDTHRQGGLRLDVKDSAFGTADSGEHPIVPGKPEASALVDRIFSDDEDLRMPPAESNKSLTDAEKELMRRWIEQGAGWQEHWSLIPPRRPELPTVEHGDWPKNAVDQFILSRLEQEELSPSPTADKATLIRRATLDLTGLPPTPQEVDAFVADDSPEAYERVVDRLLQSTRYGEHMARFWLDGARYGDTHGLHLDNYREIWPYRDWVIKAFNSNLPYDQFAIQQLAGDLLPDPTLDQLVATGFNRCHVTTNEGGSIAEEVHTRNVIDRVVTVGTVFMGMTFECTRCHDHKYDPLTMNDFYSMYAYFNSIDGNPLDGNKKDPAPVIRVPSLDQQEQLDNYDQQIAALEAKLRDPWPEVDEQQLAWEQELKTVGDTKPNALALSDWSIVGPFTDNRRYLNSKKHGPEGKPINLEDEFTVDTGEKVKWIAHPEWTDGKPHQGLPGDSAANFLYRKITAPKAQKVTVSLGSDDGIKVYLNNKKILANDVARGVAADQESLELNLKEGENHLLLKILNYGGASGFYFALKETAAIPAEVLAAAKVEAAERTPAQQQTLRDYFRNKVAQSEALTAAQGELAKVRDARAEVDRQIPTTMVFKELAEPKTAHLLKRGEYDQPGAAVTRHTPVALPPMTSELPNNRLGLAKWLVDPQHPLTSRVAVNRFWQHLFGTGLVKTAEDFGSQGEPPSHPELLDWLAVTFMENGWDVKGLMKQFVMSSTYRQSSHVSRELYTRDPENRLLARGPRFRLDAEMLRDQALFLSGLMVEKLGGPSVKPPQPDGLWFAVGYSGSNTVRFVADKGSDKLHRRTLYTFIKRTSPPPQMSTFDGPSREACVVRRERTNTPLQALLLFNDPQFVEAARGLAERTLHEGGDNDADRAAWMFRVCTGREPSEWEREALSKAIGEHLAHYRADVEAAGKLIAVGESPHDEKLDPSETAAYTMLANLLLNLDEVLTKN